ncbi:MAG TPA: hypothetical protein VEB42_01985 [Chitinophagaceae bacterium]|nr:hypothetical protein [Chitinophagaceae bacterium]
MKNSQDRSREKFSWHRLSETAPDSDTEVLVRSRGILNLALYRRENNRFFLKNGNAVEGELSQIYWLGLSKDK